MGCRKIINALHCKQRGLLKGVVALVLCASVLLQAGGATAQQQADMEEFELILKVTRGEETLSEAILAYMRGFDEFYMPVSELANLVAFEARLDLTEGTVGGWFIEPDNTYTIHADENYFTIRGERVDLNPGDVIIKRFTSDFGEIYLNMDVLNQIWPLELALNFSKLTLSINTFHKLPYELIRERQRRREEWLARQDGGINVSGFQVVDSPYEMISKPLIDVNGSVRWNSNERQLDALTNVRGRNDLLGFSADYSAQFQRRDGEWDWPDAIRTTLTRRAFGEDTMPGGIRELKLGDVSARTPDWVGGVSGGLGATVSSRPLQRNRSFDEVTIEGIATPGWEIELYRGNELVEFGIVSDTGQYRFDEVPLLTGNNIFRTVLYGPQGQTEERVEEYAIGGSLLSPGTTEYEAAIVDTKNNLIQFDRNDPFKRRDIDDKNGIAFNARIKQGINRNLSVFATGTQSQTRLGAKSYVTAGADVSVGKVLGEVEAYKEIGGGTALDTSLATSFKGWRVNLGATFLSDFESDDAGFGDSAQVFDAKGTLSKRFSTGYGIMGLSLTGEREEDKDGSTFTRYGLSNTFGSGDLRLGNNLVANYVNGDLNRVNGRFNTTHRISREWALRSLLTYDWYPERQLNDFSVDLNYRPKKDLNIGFEIGQNLESDESRLSTNVSYDFGTVLFGVDGKWREDGGVSMGLRASTSLAPFGPGGEYVLSSIGTRNDGAILGRVYQDVNLNNVYDYEDELLPDVMVELDGRDLEKTNEEGNIAIIQNERGDYKAITIDSEQTPNPFLVTSEKGYLVFMRQGVEQRVDIPMVESGVVDGRAFFENGLPVPGLRLQLVDWSGEAVKETLTSFDGYYSFEFVKPGRYVVRANPVANLMVPPRIIAVSPDALFSYGVNMELKSSPSSDIEVSDSKVRQNKGQIIGLLQNLQQTLQRAAGEQTL